ncbi:MAG: hypothetical protein HY735_36845 [Verrucomicrobia bacterium]|nr:hypothetical protein [Verrucomicrobiota bacterium]
MNRKVSAGQRCDAEGHPRIFTLSLGSETITLEPGKSWGKVDIHKWVTRGLIEEPQSFHVSPNGNVEINGEKIALTDLDGIARLEHEINKRFTAPVAHKPAAPPPVARGGTAHAAGSGPDKVHFKVKLDHLGHMMVECHRGSERMETSLRGLPMLIQNGFMLKARTIHVDPLQRAVEIDDARFECNEAGARQLEATLNERYAPKLQAEGQGGIEIKENPAAAAGFDIRFMTVRAGARFEIKGHLSQENLDVLQDPGKCELLRPGIALRISPPYLLIRRRRSDGSEEKIAELPDVQYRRITASQLQRILNHPLICRTGEQAGPEAGAATPEQPQELAQMRLERNPNNKLLLWLKCVTAQGSELAGKAFTHHNVVGLQHARVFRPELDISLSLDHRTLSILNQQTEQEEQITVDPNSPDADLAKASQMLTAALNPPSPRPILPHPEEALKPTPSPPNPETEEEEPKQPERGSPPPLAREHAELPEPTVSSSEQTEPSKSIPAATPSVEVDEPSVRSLPGREADVLKSEIRDSKSEMGDRLLTSAATVGSVEVRQDALEPAHGPQRDPAILALFQESDPLLVNTQIFRGLGQHLGVPAQDVFLSLDRVFENRRFEIISSSHPQVTSVLELRSAGFTGFYLSHITDQKILLVHACNGRHIEWGPDKCELQPAVAAEPDEFKGSALLGLAQTQDGKFVFLVTPAYQQWAKSREKPYEEVAVHFSTVDELAAAPEKYSLIWPAPSTGISQATEPV